MEVEVGSQEKDLCSKAGKATVVTVVRSYQSPSCGLLYIQHEIAISCESAPRLGAAPRVVRVEHRARFSARLKVGSGPNSELNSKQSGQTATRGMWGLQAGHPMQVFKLGVICSSKLDVCAECLLLS